MNIIKQLIILIIALALFGIAAAGIILGYLEPAFSYISYLSFITDALIFIIFGIVLFFTITIVAISIPISNIGRYYQKNPETDIDTTIIKNLKIVLKNNLLLTIPLYFSFMYLLNPSNYFCITESNCCSSGDLNSAFIVTLAIIPAYLVSLRLLTNPIRIDPPIFRSIFIILRDHYSSTPNYENLKERFMGFYFSLTASAFFIMIILYLYKSIPLNLNPFDVPHYILKSLENSFVPIFDQTFFGNLIRLLLFVIAYLIVLFVVTSFGEIILQKYQLHHET